MLTEEVDPFVLTGWDIKTLSSDRLIFRNLNLTNNTLWTLKLSLILLFYAYEPSLNEKRYLLRSRLIKPKAFRDPFYSKNVQNTAFCMS